jgi:hypothetical protein
MYTSTSLLVLAALFSSVQSHGVILSAVGDSGASQGFLGKLKTKPLYNETRDLRSCSRYRACKKLHDYQPVAERR